MEDNATNRDRQARIAERAYDRYMARGAGDGQDLDDWLEAEREIAAEAEQTPAPLTESVSARMDASVPEEIARQDRDAGAREAAFETPAAPPAKRGRTNGRTTTSAHP
jgi:hypothetical protein